MTYARGDAVGFGEKLADLGKAMLDGMDQSDILVAVAAAQAGAQAVNEFQEIPAAAGLHVVHGMTGVLGDYFEQRAIAPPAP